MSRIEEIKKQIEELEDRLFFLNMKDRWTMQDREKEMQLNLQLANLKKQLIEEQKEQNKCSTPFLFIFIFCLLIF